MAGAGYAQAYVRQLEKIVADANIELPNPAKRARENYYSFLDLSEGLALCAAEGFAL